MISEFPHLATEILEPYSMVLTVLIGTRLSVGPPKGSTEKVFSKVVPPPLSLTRRNWPL